jgi:hydrogenase small subunit
MNQISRREFLKMGASLAAMIGLGPLYAPALAEGLQEIVYGRVRILWLQGQSCTGCSVSLLDSASPGPVSLVTRYMSLAFHATLSAAQGQVAMDMIYQLVQKPGYVLIFEGAVPMGMPRASLVNDKPLEELLLPAVQNAGVVIAVGTCATYGGMPAAEGNPTGAASLRKFMEAKRLNTGNLLAVPNCPAPPESLVGSLAYYLKLGMPPKDPQFHRPTMFYSRSVHAECPRYHYYQNSQFASDFGDEHNCLFKLGCLGPISFSDCPRRQWNDRTNWCVRANSPCISCSSEYFCALKDVPFFRKGEAYRALKKTVNKSTESKSQGE